MNSPYTDKEMQRVFEKRVWKFRGEEFEYYHTSWRCTDSGEQFTTDESDTSGYIQVTNQYREKYGIPYTDEIIATREKYGISASKMSKILGFGINQYRFYEQGEVPSVSNGRLIRSINDPASMLNMVNSSVNELTSQEYTRIISNINRIISENNEDREIIYETKRIFPTSRGINNGYAQISLTRLKSIMLYILEKCNDVWYTKMNKLLFYSDFLSYRENGYSLSGLSYYALPYGPVPENWDKIYSTFPEISKEIRQTGDIEGIVLHSSMHCLQNILSQKDLAIIEKVCKVFGNKSSRELSEISHKEEAWLSKIGNKEHISFQDAYSLKGI